MRTCFVSLIQQKTTLKLNHNFLFDYYHPTYCFLSSKNLVRLPVSTAQGSAQVTLNSNSIQEFTYTNYTKRLSIQVTIGGSVDENLPLLTMLPRKLSFLGRFHRLRVKRATEICVSRKSTVVPWQLLTRTYGTSAIKCLLRAKMLALSQTSFLSCKQQAFQGPVWASQLNTTRQPLLAINSSQDPQSVSALPRIEVSKCNN